jgi:hypothetical protein
MGKKRKPYNKSTGRNYKKDYKKFQSSDKAKKDRAARNKRRRQGEKSGRVRKGDGKDIHHNGNKTRVMSASKNRGISEKSRKKGSSRKK